MATDECGGEQQLDADEEEEEPSLVLPSMFSKREPMCSEQKRERRAEEQEDSHGVYPMPKR